jgi:hypothetical protein
MRRFVQCLKSKSSKWKENGIKNQWRWHWLDTVVDGQRLGTVIRKKTEDGQAFCVPCSKTVQYQSKGLAALTGHVARPSHVKKALALMQLIIISNPVGDCILKKQLMLTEAVVETFKPRNKIWLIFCLTFDIVNFTFFLLSQPSQCFGGN